MKLDTEDIEALENALIYLQALIDGRGVDATVKELVKTRDTLRDLICDTEDIGEEKGLINLDLYKENRR